GLIRRTRRKSPIKTVKTGKATAAEKKRPPARRRTDALLPQERNGSSCLVSQAKASETGSRVRSNYGRCAGSHEHSPGFGIPGSQCGHALQVRLRGKNPRFQIGQPLEIQEDHPRSVDGAE